MPSRGDEGVDVAQKPQQGWFSLLRWRADTARDEARNVALLLVEERGGFNAFKAAPLSRISSRLQEQGLLDATLVALEQQFGPEQAFTLERLTSMHDKLHHSLYLTKPRPVAVQNLDETVGALYKAFIATRGGGGTSNTKNALLDRVVSAYRKQGVDVRRGAYINDFIFDAILRRGKKRSVVEVLSFATPRKDWTPIEWDAGHFLFALRELDVQGTVVVQEPTAAVPQSGRESYRRVMRWLQKADIPVASPQEIIEPRLSLDVGV
jgi:hypothetical protein